MKSLASDLCLRSPVCFVFRQLADGDNTQSLLFCCPCTSKRRPLLAHKRVATTTLADLFERLRVELG